MKLSEDLKRIAEDQYATDYYILMRAAEFVASVESWHNCNDCGRTDLCAVMPKWGKPAVYNCPFWIDRSEGC